MKAIGTEVTQALLIAIRSDPDRISRLRSTMVTATRSKLNHTEFGADVSQIAIWLADSVAQITNESDRTTAPYPD